MTTTSSIGKIAYIYDQGSDTWYPVAGSTNTAANFDWNGAHTFASSVSFNSVVNAKAGINNFLNPAARDAAIITPTNGVVVFVRQDATGNVINEIQYYYNGSWREYNDSARILSKTDNYTLSLLDAGKTIKVTASTNKEIIIPLNSSVPFVIGQKIEIIRNGSGEVAITVANFGVTINSKNGNKRIASQYSGAVLLKDDTNTWILIGDLKA